MNSDQFLHYTGVLTCSYVLFKIASFARLRLRPTSLSRYLHQGKKSWALITGSSDGIGVGFAQELCSRGFNIILHGRNAQKLGHVKESLSRDFPTAEIRIVLADALQFSESSLNDLVASLSDLHITVLINNVGGTAAVVSSTFKSFEESTYLELDRQITVNDRFSTLLTKAFLPALSRNGPSLILNTGSIASMGMAYVAVYSATKAYLKAFTRGLCAELSKEGRNIEVLGVLVGTTCSGQNQREASLMTPTSRTMAAASLNKVGCGQSNVVPYLPHALQLTLIDLMPEGLVDSLTAGYLKPLADSKSKVF